MTLRHFDVVVLGRSLGCLATAALLARRDFRVMLLGQGQPSATYSFGEYRLPRRSFSVLFSNTPVWRRIVQDLAQSQTFRRMTSRHEPSFGVVSSRQRLEVFGDRQRFAAELARAFPEIRPLVEELVFLSSQASQELDRDLERDRVWPPEGFWARIWEQKFGPQHPLGKLSAAELLERIPAGHDYRSVALLSAQFAGNWGGPAESLPALSVARLASQWRSDVVTFQGGANALESFFVGRIEAHGGFCELGEKADRILCRRGKVVGIEMSGGERSVGAERIVTGLASQQLAALVEEDPSHREVADSPVLRPTAGRFVVSCLVRSTGLARSLAGTSFFPEEGGVPALQVQKLPCANKPELSWLVAETLLELSEKRGLKQLRERVVGALCTQLPFLKENLLLCDSPHDGLPLEVFELGHKTLVERHRLKGTSRGPEPMEPLWETTRLGHLGLAGESAKGPFSSTYLVGKTVFPGLGQEGELLAGWLAAKGITRSDRTWQDRKRQMWTKIDTDLS